MAEYADPTNCPECGASAPKIPSAANHTFAHVPVGGARPQNTGVHAIDHSFDRVIGRDAEAKWKVIEDRQKHKRDVLKENPGATGHDLSRTSDGTYRVMPQAERTVKDTARQAGIQATKSEGGGA